MRPVQGGTQKLTMNSSERDYQQRLKQAQAQGDGNPMLLVFKKFLILVLDKPLKILERPMVIPTLCLKKFLKV